MYVAKERGIGCSHRCKKTHPTTQKDKKTTKKRRSVFPRFAALSHAPSSPCMFLLVFMSFVVISGNLILKAEAGDDSKVTGKGKVGMCCLIFFITVFLSS